MAVRIHERATLDIDPTVESLESDGLRPRQILLNLLANACSFTKGGQITLRLRPEGAEHVLFEVEDTGIGMTPDQMGRVFEAFSQAESGTSRRYGGTGTGLAISLKLANAIGGSLVVRSDHGKGCVFSLLLPRSMPGDQA